MDLKLSLQEQEELSKASSAFNLDNYTKTLTLKYYLEYRHKVGQIYIEKLPLIVNCAILAASKSQVLTTVKGETVRGIGISITQLMRGFTGNNKNTFSFDEFLIVLKEFIHTVVLASDVTKELEAIVENFAFSYTFFIKYSNLIKQLDFKDTSYDEDYFKHLKNLGWLIYINAKSSLLQNQNELVESFFLLTATLAHMIYYLPNHVSVHFFEKSGKNIYDKNTKKKSEELILIALQDLIKVGSSGFENIIFHQKSLQDYLLKLVETDVLKSAQPKSFEGMYDSKVIFANFGKLEIFYQKKLNHDDLDERFFIRDRKPHIPGKFTPFARQGAANKVGINFNLPKPAPEQAQPAKKSFSSHRMLNYELSDQVTMKTNLNEIKFAVNKAVPASPYTKLLPATPMTRALEMYNWLSEKTKIKRSNSGLTLIIDKHLSSFGEKFKENILLRANSLVEKILLSDKDAAKAPINQKTLNDKHTQIVNLYLKVLEDLLLQEEKKPKESDGLEILKTDAFHRALLACSIETSFFINNTSNITFVRLLELCEIEAFDFWRIIGNFAKFDQQMPYPIKKHLYDLEFKIMMSLAWKKNSTVHQTVKYLIEENDSGKETERFPRITEANESPRSSDSSDSNQDTTKSFDKRKNLPSERKSCANTTVLLDASTYSETKAAPRKEIDSSHETFFKRVLHFTALQVYQLCNLLHLHDKISEQIWAIMKYILSSEIDLLIGRHMEQLILCAVYGICKISGQPLKFQDIISKYQELPSFNKNEFLKVIHQVHIDDNEKADLIRFYNSIFIVHMRTFLFSMLPDNAQVEIKSATPMIKKPVIRALVMESPLKDSVPHSMIQYASLSAYNKNKSPLIRHAFGGQGGIMHPNGDTMVSKRQINFDDAHEGGNMENNTMRKSKFPTMDRIIEQKTEDVETDSSKKTSSKRNLFGANNQASTVKKNINFEETPTASAYQNQNQNPNIPVSFSNMIQPKSQMMLYSMRSPKGNLENMQNSPPENKNVQVQAQPIPENVGERSGIGKALRKLDSLTPEFRK